jgi:Ca2+:H+ antiporter
MNDSSDEPPLPKSPHSWARIPDLSRLNPFRSGNPGSESTSVNILPQYNVRHDIPGSTGVDASEEKSIGQDTEQQNRRAVDKKGEGEEPSPIAEDKKEPKLPLGTRFKNDVKHIIFSSWINVLLIFVPVGIALGAMVKAKGDAAPVSPSVVFAINAIAIIPLASMLSFATESVAAKLGDTIGALLNVTFGNAVELIIFIIALVANEIRIVQASLLGSILANLLLILGMCFVFGGLRFREQVREQSIRTIKGS